MARLDPDQIVLEKAWFICMSAAALIVLLLPQLYISNIDSVLSLKQFLSSTGDPRINILIGLWGIGVILSAVCLLYFVSSLRFKRQPSRGMQYTWCLSFFPPLLAIIVVSDIYTRAAQNAIGEHIVIVGLLYIALLIVGVPLLIIRQGKRNYNKAQAHKQIQDVAPSSVSFWSLHKRRLMLLGFTTFLIVIASSEFYSVQYFINLTIGIILVVAIFSIYNIMFKYMHHYWNAEEVKEFLASRIWRK